MHGLSGILFRYTVIWGRIETGERKPTLGTVFKLAAALGVPPADLFVGIG